MKSRLHIASRMFLKDPYVVRVRHAESTMGGLNLSKFRQMLKTAKSQIQDTWGYSNPEYEVVKTSIGGQAGFMYSMPEYECHSYWVFTNEMDALQFRLTVGDDATQMHMWPTKIKYTITEYFEDNEDT